MIYPNERHKSFNRFYRNKETVNGVSLVEGQKLFIDGSPALIIRAWQDGVITQHLIAVTAKPYDHVSGQGLAEKMIETSIALDPQTPAYRSVKIRVENRTDDFDVMAYGDAIAKKYENS